MRELSLHLLDIAENAVAAGAALVTLTVRAFPVRDLLVLRVRDDGRGMTAGERARATDPFYTTRKTRKIGMGIPLLKAAARQAGGRLCIRPAIGRGTVVCAAFGLRHIDRAPLGDMGKTYCALLQGAPETEFVYTLATPAGRFCADTRILRQAAGGLALTKPAVLCWLDAYIEENTQKLLHTNVDGGYYI